jgi:hypothetical protein
MNEVLGLIDSIEATILEGKKVPFSEKVVLDERRLLGLLDKLRLVVKNDSTLIRRSIEMSSMDDDRSSRAPVVIETPTGIHPDVLRQAEDESLRVRRNADEYADNVLAHLQMVVTRAQKNMIKLEQSIESGRDHLETRRNESKG